MNQIALKLNSIALTVLLVTLAFEATAIAQRIPFGKTSRKTGQLNLTQDAGPWLVMCAAFDGPDGRQQAINLADELRKTNRMNAYVFRQHFDFAKDIIDRGMGFSKPTAPGKTNLRQREMELLKQSEKTEYAVLVGDYKSFDSHRAQSDLAKIKKLQPESLKRYSASVQDTALPGERLRAESEAMFGTGENARHLSTSAARSKFPLRLAILVTNPMIPEEVLAQAGVDQHIMGLNRGLKYSLLDNPKAYTLKIATFSGQVIVRPEDIARLEADRAWNDRNKKGKNNKSLIEATKRATILTNYLRGKGVDAYLFIDRYSTYVCVGGFDWVRKGEGPNAQANPEVAKLAKLFAAKPVGGGQVTTFPLPPGLLAAGVTCDSNPLTVEVPRARKASLPSRLR